MPRERPVSTDRHVSSGRPISVARYVRDASHHATTPVTHSYAALSYYTGGTSRVEQNGAFRLEKGDVLLVPAGEPHRMLGSEAAELWGLSFCVSCFAADGTSTLLDPFERVRRGASGVVRIPEARRAYFEALFVELERISSQPRAPSRSLDAVERSLLTLILAEVDGVAGATQPTTGASVVADALRFIERNCLGPLTLKEVAHAVHKSPAYVTTALTQATGKSAVQWIVASRMAEARRLLLHSDEMIDVIAERVGYADATHFIRMFRREHGMTPAAWRASQTRPTRAGRT